MLPQLGAGGCCPSPRNDRLASAMTAAAMAIWPGLSIFLLVLSFNLLGDGLRDALDPRHK